MSKKILFFGNERLATGVTTTTPTLRALVAAGYEIEAVIANHRDPVSRQKRDLEVGLVAHEYDIPVILPGEKVKLIEKVKRHQAEAAVLVAFGKIIPKEVIDLFPKGIINIHPSILPAYRGPTPIEQTILDGASPAGVSLMHLTPKMDAGPVFAQAQLKLNGTESKQELADQLGQLGSQLLVRNLANILSDQLRPTAQDETKASYTKLLSKAAGRLRLDQPAEVLERQVRAYAGWPGVTADVGGHQIIILKSRVAKDDTDGELVVAAQPDYLEIEELIGPSGRRMSGGDFKRGYRLG